MNLSKFIGITPAIAFLSVITSLKHSIRLCFLIDSISTAGNKDMHPLSIKEDLATAQHVQDLRLSTEGTETSQQVLDRRETRLRVEDICMMRVVGYGTFAKVRVAVERGSNRIMAVKTMEKSAQLIRKSIKRLREEKSVLSKLHHPLIVDYYGSLQDSKHLYLLLGYVPGGELYSLLSKRGKFSISQAHFYVTEVAAALLYLHSEGIVYRDLKPENVLIAASGHIKLTDFGFAKRLKLGERTFSLVGTPHCLAPEIVKRCGHGFESDWWTLGILLYELIVGESPFVAATPYEMYLNIVSKDFVLPKEIDSVTESLLIGLLQKAPEARLKDSEVRSHPFFGEGDWEHVQRMTPPHVPIVKEGVDTSHFDDFPDCGDSQPEVIFDDSIFEGF